MRKKSNSLMPGIACGAGAGALWGLVFLAPELVRDFSPLQIAIGRYLAYGLISLMLIAPRCHIITTQVQHREWIALGLLALFGNILYYILLSSAVQMSGVAITSLIIGFLPVTITIVGSRVKGAVPLSSLAPSLLLCLAGILCIGWQTITAFHPANDVEHFTGILCATGALMSWTIYAIGNSQCLSRLGKITSHDWNLLTGLMTGAQAALILPVAAMLENFHHEAEALARFVGVAIGIAILASIMGNALWNKMSRLLPMTMMGQMILFETLFALLYGYLWEQRLPTMLELMAFGFVCASVISCINTHHRHTTNKAKHEGDGRALNQPHIE